MEYESTNPTSLQKLGLRGYVGCRGVWLRPQAPSLCSVIFCAVDDGWMALRTAERRKSRAKVTRPHGGGQAAEFSPIQPGSKKTELRLLVGCGQVGVGW